MAFNYRYMPVRTQIKEMLGSGAIGDVTSVDFHWMLDTHHGADYFRRWHSQKQFSGGLMVHKATHHFDLVNWWLSAMPVTVRASGRRDFYTPAMAKRLGLASHHERCHTCPEKKKCSFELDLAKSAQLKSLYLDQEKHDGYHRDRCVFRPDIDIEDSMSVVVTYDTDATLTYSLTAFAPWEGYAVTFNGTKGRLEHKVVASPSRDARSRRRQDVRHLAHRPAAAQARYDRHAANRRGRPRRRRPDAARRPVRADPRARPVHARRRRTQRRLLDPGRRRRQPLFRHGRNRPHRRPGPQPRAPGLPAHAHARGAGANAHEDTERGPPGTALAVRVPGCSPRRQTPRFLATAGAAAMAPLSWSAGVWWIALAVLVLNDHVLSTPGCSRAGSPAS